jgi:hypothetical protein
MAPRQQRPVADSPWRNSDSRSERMASSVGHLRQAQHGEDHGLPVRAPLWPSDQACTPRHTAPISRPTHSMCCHRPWANTLSSGRRGGRCITPRSAGSAASASPGRPSVTRLTHRMWIGSSGIGRPSSGARKQHPDLARVAGQRVADELADVVEDAPAFAHRPTMVAKLSSSSTRLAASRATSVPPRPMATPMSAAQRGRVVHAVAGHRDELALRLQGAHDADLLRRVHRGRRRATRSTCAASAASSISASSAPVSTRCAPRSRCPGRCAMASAVAGWSPVIITDPHAGLVALRDRGLGLGPGRVDQADQSEQGQPAFEVIGSLLRDRRIAVAAGDGQHAHPLAGHGLDAPQDVGPVQRLAAGIAGAPVAARQQRLRSPFDVRAPARAAPMQRGHALALGIERPFVAARPLRPQRGDVDAVCAGAVHQRGFGRIADPSSILRAGVVAQRAGPQQLVGRIVQRVDVAHVHLVQGERAGLVRADRAHRAQGLDCWADGVPAH